MVKRRPKVRKVIDGFATATDTDPKYIDMGNVFMFPSQSDLGGYNIVVWFPKRELAGEAFLCGCKGFRYSTEDECRHVHQLKEEIEAER